MWRLLLGTMGVKSLVLGLNAAATAGFEPRTVWSEVRRRNRLATGRLWNSSQNIDCTNIVPASSLFSNSYVSVGQRERPNGLSVGSWSVRGKKVVFSFIRDKIRIGSLIYRPDRRRRASQTGWSSSRVVDRIVVSSWPRNRWLATGISSSVHNTHTHTHFWHTPSHFALRQNVFSCLCPKNVSFFD